MKNKSYKFFSLVLISLVLLSCKNQDLVTNATIKYGTSFGMCVGYCNQEVVLNGATAVLTKNKNGNNPDTKVCTKELDAAVLTAIRNNINFNELSDLPDVIGCPDCADGGAEFIEIRSNGKTKKVVFEYGKIPPSLIGLIKEIKPIFNSFGDCQ